MFSSTFMTLGLLFVTALSSPASDAGPELRGPRWRADAAAQVQTADVTGDLRNPFTTGRGGVAAEHATDEGGSLRDPFGGRGGVAQRRDHEAPIAPASRARTRAATPIPAAQSPELNDPFARSRSAAPQPAPAGGGSLRRRFGAP
ncbi:MAG TPA: hypothetical protein VG755_22910 [Nannocystaceae bacterium]|nr:hypothetical protein [Nannocystaceae bacterium]